MAAKRKNRKKKNPSVGGHRKRHHSTALARFHHRRNPILPPGETYGSLAIMGLSAGGGAILSSYLPSRFFASADVGLTGYAMNILVALLGGMALAKVHAKAALGFVVGGVAMTIGRVWDDKTGQNVIAVNLPSAPTGVSSFFVPGSYPLPAPGPYNAVPPLALSAAPVTVSPTQAAAAKQGMGWNARLAA